MWLYRSSSIMYFVQKLSPTHIHTYYELSPTHIHTYYELSPTHIHTYYELSPTHIHAYFELWLKLLCYLIINWPL